MENTPDLYREEILKTVLDSSVLIKMVDGH